MEIDLTELITPYQYKARKVFVPERGEDAFVYVAELRGDERDRLDMQWGSVSEGGQVGFRKYVVTWCLSDADNVRRFDSGTDEKEVSNEFREAMQAIGEAFPASALNRIFDMACRLSGLTAEDQETMEKNSETIHSGGGSGSNHKQPENLAAIG